MHMTSDLMGIRENYYKTLESKYKILTIPDDEDLLEMTRKLVPEQLQGLSKIFQNLFGNYVPTSSTIMHYCKLFTY